METGRLQARLKTRERREKSYYYITVPHNAAHALLVDRALLASLHSALPTLRIMHLMSPGNSGMLLIDEFLFNDVLETFLRLLEDPSTDPTGVTP